MDGMTDALTYTTPEEAQAADEERNQSDEDDRKRELVKLARQRFTMAEEAERDIRIKADEDLRFRAGEQWDAQVLRQRSIEKRPALVINRMPQFERQITNEQRQARPAIVVSPIDSSADPDTAQVLQGLIRHIEYDSSADVAYDTALTSAVRGGLGYMRAITEYETEDSFEQCLKIKRVRDPFSVYMDPCAQEQDGSDANWAFVVDDGIAAEEFEKYYPDAEPVTGGWGSRSTNAERICQVVEYFYREQVEDELLTLQAMGMDPRTGQPMPMAEPITALASCVPQEILQHSQVLARRPTHRTKVCWAKIAGSTVVAETEFPSKWIPIVPVLGDELWVDGKRILEGIVRNAKDPQRMYNYWSTAITEAIALAPKAPFIGYEGQFAGHEKKWAEAASRNIPYLEVKPVTLDGKPAPVPQRNAYDAPIGAMTQAMQFAAEDMKATTGIYDAALGNRSNEQTGVAIRARQGQSQTSTLHFTDNLARAMRHLGRMLIDAIPRVYSGARIVRILGEDQSERMVAVNGAPPMEGQERIYDLGVGRYDVAVSMGPSYTSKRQEAVAAALELSRSNPQIAQVISDLMVRNMDWPGAQQMADRLKKLLPPGIAEDDQGPKTPPAVLAQQNQQLQQMLQQSQGMIQELSQAVHNAHDRIDAREQELASKERIALLNAQVELLKTKAQLNSSDANRSLDRLQADIHKRLELDGEGQPMDNTSTSEAPRAPMPPPAQGFPQHPFLALPQGVPNAVRPAPGPAGQPPAPGGIPGGGPPGGGPGGPGGPPGGGFGGPGPFGPGR